MKPIKPILILSSLLFVVILVLPTLLVIPFTEESTGLEKQSSPDIQSESLVESESAVEVSVYRSKSKEIEKIPLEEYVVGVVASEMPAEFEMEALKAQALSARTYILKQLLNEEKLSSPEGAVVTDTVIHQVFKSKDELQEIWGADYDWKLERIREAVLATKGKVITYNEQPITAAFFSTSNGFTENSEDYWTNPFPYLRSVESPWDKESPKFLDRLVIPVSEFERKLGVKVSNEIGKIMQRTDGNRVAKVQFANKTLNGREVREQLGLRSSDFMWERKGDKVVITTKGYGHGVGMSQYGANGMAAEGMTFKDIITHYYKGTSIQDVEFFLNKVVAMNKK